MKKILISLALSVVCLVITVGSFLTNDVANYKKWMVENHTKVMAPFDMGKPRPPRELPPPPPEGPHMVPPREGAPERMDKHHDRNDNPKHEEKKQDKE